MRCSGAQRREQEINFSLRSNGGGTSLAGSASPCWVPGEHFAGNDQLLMSCRSSPPSSQNQGNLLLLLFYPLAAGTAAPLGACLCGEPSAQSTAAPGVPPSFSSSPFHWMGNGRVGFRWLGSPDAGEVGPSGQPEDPPRCPLAAPPEPRSPCDTGE